jgi:GNAT superfamily N-acetyltransferase
VILNPNWQRLYRTHEGARGTYALEIEEGWVYVEEHSPGSHVANLRLKVNEDRRREGIGTYLVEQAKALARDQGILRLEATPYVDNPESRRFTASLEGFVFEGEKRWGGMRDGQSVNTLLYAWVCDD